MIGLFLAVLFIILLILFVLRIIFDHTDFQTWLNILIVTVILFTVILSIYIILNRVNTSSDTPATKSKITKEETLEKPSTKPAAIKQKDVSEMSDDELSLMLAEKYLTLKTEYEKEHEDGDGAAYAKQKIMEEYDLTDDQWEALYDTFVQDGYLDKAAKNLNLDIDYLIKTK